MGNNKTQFWKGLEELHKDEEFESRRYNEFAEKLPIGKVATANDLNLSASRRDFLKFMGFSISAASLAACTKTPVKKAIPHVNNPVEQKPGIADFYATTCTETGEALRVLARSREGRPVKIEGNDLDPFSAGGTSAIAQGSVLSLYDDGRLKQPMVGNEASDWSSFDKAIIKRLNKISQDGGAIRILASTTNSPSLLAAIDTFKEKYGNTELVQYDAVSAYGLTAAHEQAFGLPYVPDYHFNKARAVVSFDADFLGTWIAPTEYTKKYTAARNVDKLKEMLYHVQFETNLSLTGSNADFRVPMKPSQHAEAVLALYNHIAKKAGRSTAGSAEIEFAGNAIKHSADELWKHKGKSIVISGSNNPDVQVLIAGINEMLGNYGKTIDLERPSFQKMGNDKALAQLVSDMKAGRVDGLIVMDSNPLYTYPDVEGFKAGLKKVKLRVTIAEREDETARLFNFVAPRSHYLESWGDVEVKAGFYALQQPTIPTIFDTRTATESMLVWARDKQDMYTYVQNYWRDHIYKGTVNEETEGDDEEENTGKKAGADFKRFWEKALHDGFYVDKDKKMEVDYTAFNANVSAAASNAKKAVAKTSEGGKYEIKLYEKIGIGDGKHTNNPWLMELPDPVSKVCWDNYATLSPKLAEEMGIKDEDLVTIQTGGTSVEVPALLQPGQAYGTIGLAVGFGRDIGKNGGKVVNGIGANAYAFAKMHNNHLCYHTGVEMSKAGGQYPLAKTQIHHHIEGRDLVREVSLDDYVKDPKSAKGKKAHIVQIYPGHDDKYKTGHHWGMAIDLNACTGCGACVVSCQAENNIPVVGKQEVRRGREMHWLRIDRYYRSSEKDNVDAAENPQVVFQPMMCQQCDNAPCENVCPVAAISHSSEGLNQQVYNRCVGTRYCANNCPYKVRRFNWFSYYNNDKFDYLMNNDLGKMVINPDVTVRARGVMEKCTFCVQKLQAAKLEAKKEQRKLKDGEAQTACQKACPANAIIFGDMNDKDSEIYKFVNKNYRSYRIIEDLNTQSSVRYVSKIRHDKAPKEV